MNRRYAAWCARLTLLLGLVAGLAVSGGAGIAQSNKSVRKVKQKKHRPGDQLLGEWWTEGREGRVRFVRHKNGTFRGITTCCKPDKHDPKGRMLFDRNNPNPKLRSRSTVGIVIIWKLKYEGDGEYGGGKVYNPRDGDTYGFQAELVNRNTLEIRGFLGIPLLGQTQTWKRARIRRK